MTSLKGHILIAMPDMEDSRFQRTIIYICEHSANGAMGIVLNRPLPGMRLSDVLQQVTVIDDVSGQPIRQTTHEIAINRGGPVETGRGFVLHSADYHIASTSRHISDGVSLTETLEILKDIANNKGPARAFLALGYAGWGAGQLEQEIQRNDWLHASATQDIVFMENADQKYQAALAHLGIDPVLLSSTAGHA